MVQSHCLTGSETTMTSYREIARDIAGRIVAGEWAAGGKVPSTAAFADEYGVHQNTAHKALALLTERGLLVGRPGSGRYVAGPHQI